MSSTTTVTRASGAKCEEAAKTFRLKGNTHYQKKQFKQALKEYNHAILVAPHGSCEPALSFANRSALFYQTNDWQRCLQDIQQALHHHYPVHKQYKLYRRKTQCLMQLQRYQEASEALEVAKCQLERNVNSGQDEKDTIDNELKKIFERLSLKQQAAVKGDHHKTQAECDFVESDDIHCASDTVSLQYNTSKGRHLVAKVTIPAGTSIIKEKPFTGVLLPAFYLTHCSQCFAETTAPIPCPLCTRVRYCSDMCQQRSMTSYHWAECPYWNLLQQIGTFAHLGFRILLVSGLQNIKEQLNIDNEESRNLTPGCSSNNHYHGNYKAVWNLMTNDGIHSPEVLQHFQKLSSELIQNTIDHLMSNKTWSLQDSEAQSKGKECLIGQLTKALNRHWLQLHCNAHAVTTIGASNGGGEVAGHNVVDVEQKRIATVVFPTTSLLNHSCKPNVIVRNDEIIVRTIRTIEAGEELLHCYGPHYQHMKKKERQAALKKQYNFECQCEACTDNEDNRSDDGSDGYVGDLEDLRSADETGKKKTIVDEIKKDLLESMALFEMASKLLDEDKIKESLELLLRCCEIQTLHLHKHHKSLSQTQDCISRCYAILGDFGSASEYLKLSISTVEKRFGPSSIEFANELHKLAAIQFNMQDIEEAMVTINKCLPLLICHYGNDHELVNDLLEMKETLDYFTS